MYGYIYKFTLIPTGKIYVGKHKATKFDENYYGSGKYWLPEVEKYGKDQVKREILEWCLSEDELNSREIFWIKELNSRDKNIGYNKAVGGFNPSFPGELNPRYGKIVSDETRQKISKANAGKRYTKEINKKKGRPGVKKPDGFGEAVSKGLMGHKVSEETKLKLKEAAKHRKPPSEETRKKLSLPGDKNGMFGYKWSDEQRKHMHDILSGRKLTDEQKKKQSEAQKGKKLYTNGYIKKYVYPGKDIPVGFILSSEYNKLSEEEKNDFKSRYS